MKRRTILIAGSVAAATLLSAMLPMSRLLVWNTTASVPTGLYRIGDGSSLKPSDRVVITPSPQLRGYLARRNYLPVGVPLLKEIAGLPGDTVCRSGSTITINDRFAGTARALDSAGRKLPVWQGCQTLTEDAVFVMNRRAPASFDGRYFGPTQRQSIVGRAIPLWTDEAGDGVHVWFAPPTISPPPINHEGDDQ